MGRVQSGRGPRALDDKGDMVDQDYQDGYEAGARGARRELGALRAEVDRLATLCDVETDRACDEGIAATKWRGECDRLRAELADLRCDDSCSRTVEELQTRAWDAEAAIARVRELCDRVSNAVDEQSWPEIPNAAVKMIAAMVLRALAEGSE